MRRLQTYLIPLILGLHISYPSVAGRSFFEESIETNKQRIISAAEASSHVYEVYDSFENETWRFSPSATTPGYFYSDDILTKKFGRAIYKLEGVFCAKEILKHSECGLFVAFYKSLDGKFLPILAAKGTSSAEDWKANVFNRGAFFVSWLFELVKARSDDGLEDHRDLQQTLEFFRSFMGDRVILTGHSLGGGLMQAIALAISNEALFPNPPRIDLLTFNSLAGESLLKKLGQSFPRILKNSTDKLNSLNKRKEDFQIAQGILPSNILPFNISTQDDFLQGLNAIIRKKNIGANLKLPTLRPVVHRDAASSLVGSFEGHTIKVLLEDLNFTYDYPHSLAAIQLELQRTSSLEAQEAATHRAKTYMRDFHIDESDYTSMGTVYAIENEPRERIKSLKRMIDVLENKELLRILGIR